MSKINAKQELLREIEYYNLKILKIDCIYRDFHKNMEIPCTTLKDLDFYYEEYAEPAPFLGNVYCIDKKSGDIVWLERYYGGDSYYWECVRIPVFVKEFIINNSKILKQWKN